MLAEHGGVNDGVEAFRMSVQLFANTYAVKEVRPKERRMESIDIWV
jgi:hypothetical protein